MLVVDVAYKDENEDRHCVVCFYAVFSWSEYKKDGAYRLAYKVAYKQGTGAHAFADLGQCPGFAKEPTAVFQQSHGMHS